MGRWPIVVGGITVLLLAAVGSYFVPAVQDALFARAAANAAGTRDDLLASDALRVLVCGSRGPLPHPERAQTCVAVLAAGRLFVIDAGAGSANNLARWQVPIGALQGVFVTHLHSDHIGDLGELNTNSWIAGRPAPLKVYGPQGIERVTHGFNTAYAIDRGYRTQHHGPAVANPRTAPLAPVALPLRKGGNEFALVYDDGGIRVMAFVVDHDPAAPALGYRFEYGDRSVVISGDTSESERLVKYAASADLLLHDALAAHLLPTMAAALPASRRPSVGKILADIPSYHATPLQAAGVAQRAKVGQLVLYHLVPAPRNDLMERLFLRGVADVRPDTRLADDGMLITLPAQPPAARGAETVKPVVEFGHM